MACSDGRYRALDAYRGIAACLVLLFHYNRDFQLGLERLCPAVDRLNLLVDFFFVLSGFVVMTAYGERMAGGRSYLVFLRRRLARLYPLHLLTLAAFCAIGSLAWSGVMRANHPEYLAPALIPANLALVQAWGLTGHDSFNVPSWSISAEWFLYLVFPVLAFPARRWGLLPNLVLLGCVVLLIHSARDAASLGPWTEATSRFGALRALPTFFAGMLIAARFRRGVSPLLQGRISWLTVHGLFACALLAMQAGWASEIVIVLLVGVVGAAVLAERDGQATRLAAPDWQRLGAISYSIYMLHVLLSIPVLWALRATGQLGTPAAAGAAAVTFGAVLVISDLVYRRFERPCRLWMAGEAAAGVTVLRNAAA